MSATNNDKRQFNAEDFERYASGRMPAAEMNALEKAALEDPFLADALEGYLTGQEDGNKGNIAEHRQDLQARLNQRIAAESRVWKMQGRTGWKVAAAFLLLAGAGILLYSLLQTLTPAKPGLAKNESHVERQVAADSVAVSTSEADAMKTIKKPGDSIPPAPELVKSKPRVDKSGRSRTAASEPLSKVQHEENALSEPAGDIAVMQEGRENSAPAPTRKEVIASSKSDATVNTFRGKVINPQNQPVPGASILVENRSRRMATDTSGTFDFSLSDSSARVEVRAEGFEPANATLQTEPANNEIRLRKNKRARSENVVAGYGTQRENMQTKNISAKISEAIPAGGWVAYDEYIGRNKKLPVNNGLHGDVVLSFLIGSQGKPDDLRIEKPLAPEYDQEALRLVSEGPAWILPKNEKSRTTIIVKF